tara:strand:+ start:147 stop:350 length:204 start_codon:yes stop_codon:yes gene_type:complete
LVQKQDKGNIWEIKQNFITSLIMFKNIKISNLTYEMLVETAKKSRPQVKPEYLVEELIKGRYKDINT